jgi:hypothetical protein
MQRSLGFLQVQASASHTVCLQYKMSPLMLLLEEALPEFCDSAKSRMQTSSLNTLSASTHTNISSILRISRFVVGART